MTALAARCELGGGARQHSRFNNCGEGGRRRALSPTFPAGELVIFIPWRMVADDSGAAHFVARPARAGAAAADRPGQFLFRDIPVRGDDGGRAIGATSYRVAAPRARIESCVDWTLRRRVAIQGGYPSLITVANVAKDFG